MDEKTKESIIANALERGELRLSLELWQYFPILDGICSSFRDNNLKRHSMFMAVLEDVALDAWRIGLLRGQEKAHNESQDPKDT